MDLTPEILYTVGAALAGAISILWRQTSRSTHLTHSMLKDSNERLNHATKDLVKLNRTVGALEGRQAGIESLAKSVLEVVRDESRR